MCRRLSFCPGLHAVDLKPNRRGSMHGSGAKRWMRFLSEKLAAVGSAGFAALSLFLLFSPISFRAQSPEIREAVRRRVEAADGGGRCDLFKGKWVWDDRYPLYESKDCAFIDQGFRCAENGRPDRLYTKWRWQPARCTLPRFDAQLMLERLRNRQVVFAGDSIGRNQWESLLCMLSSGVANKDDAGAIYEVDGNPITKHKGSLAFRFRDYNCTVEYYRAPHLVLRSRPPAGAPDRVKSILRVDAMDWRSARWRDAHVLVFNTGHWWNSEKTIKSGCYFQEGNEIQMQMSIERAYQRSIKTLLEWIFKEVNSSKTQVIFRTYSPAHLSSGGTCHSAKFPDLSSSSESSSSQLESWSLFLAPFRKRSDMDNSSTHPALRALEVLNITGMSGQRRDGHQSLFNLDPASRPSNLSREDCSHWCLPGVPDAWNELLYALFLEREFIQSNNDGQRPPVES